MTRKIKGFFLPENESLFIINTQFFSYQLQWAGEKNKTLNKSKNG